MTLEIEAAADPIAGRVRVQRGAVRDFTGWVELTRMVEETLAASRDRRCASSRLGRLRTDDLLPPA